MPYAWQLWLSPRPLNRAKSLPEPHILAAHDAALFEFLTGGDGREVIRETHYIDNPVVKSGKSGPPLHIHLLQNEYFQVEQGILAVHRNGEVVVATKEDGIIEVPAGTRHRFWAHHTGKEDLIFKVWARPQGLDRGFDEIFIRHLIGYLRDCQKCNLEPSVFQLMLFAESSATVATPSFWVPTFVLKSVQYALAYGIGGFVLGYKDSYPEYHTVATTPKTKSI
ncbi:putative oxidoreductase virH [Paramyrothecium foliicola]|nr:putative oxidoreductase virH [Paramyrothecium foliicola]